MTFKENINRICAERGTNLTAVITKVKGSSSMTTAINKKGSIPKETDLIALAKELDCFSLTRRTFPRSSRETKTRKIFYEFTGGCLGEPSMSSCLWSTSSRTGRN